jgi:type III secretory pathway component EscR
MIRLCLSTGIKKLAIETIIRQIRPVNKIPPNLERSIFVVNPITAQQINKTAVNKNAVVITPKSYVMNIVLKVIPDTKEYMKKSRERVAGLIFMRAAEIVIVRPSSTTATSNIEIGEKMVEDKGWPEAAKI